MKINIKPMIVIAVMCITSGCDKPGGEFILTNKSEHNISQLIVFRSGIGIGDVDIAIDSNIKCTLSSGSAFNIPINSGEHSIKADNSLSPGLSILMFSTLDGKTEFISIAANKGRIARGFIPIYGWFNSFVEANMNKNTPHSNLFSIEEVDEQTATKELQGLTSTKCEKNP